MWRIWLTRECRQHPGRTLLTMTSVAIAVAAISAVTIAGDSITRAYETLQQQISGPPAVEIVATTGGRFDAGLADRLQVIPGVRRVVPSMSRPSVLRFRGQRVTVVLVGLPTSLQNAGDELALDGGTWLPESDDGDYAGALLDAGLAKQLQLVPGERVILLSRQGTERMQVVGTVARRGPAGVTGVREVLVSLEVLQDMFAAPGQIDTIRLLLERASDAPAVIEAATKALQPGLIARRSVGRLQMGDATLQMVRQGLNFASLLTLAMAVFIILNTFLMKLSERRKQFAILRCLGATRAQIARLLLVEGALIGIAGTVLGLIAGAGLAVWLAKALAGLLQLAPPPVAINGRLLMWAALVGPAMSVLAVYLPARLAGGIQSLEALAVATPQAPNRFPRGVLAVACGLWLCSCVLLWGVVTERLSGSVAPGAGVLMLISFVLMIPAATGTITRALTWCLARVAETEAELAQSEVLRRRTRTALTVAILVIAVGNGVGLGNTIANYTDDVRQWYRRTMIGDLFLLNLRGAPPPASLEEQIAERPQVESVDTFGFATARVNNQPALAIVRSFSRQGHLPFEIQSGADATLHDEFNRGDVILGAALAYRLGTAVGASVSIETVGQARPLRVAAIVSDYTFGGMSLYLERRVAQRLFGIEAVDMYIVRAPAAARDAVRADLESWAVQHDLSVQTFDDLNRFVTGLMDHVVVAFWGLLLIGFVVSFFGIANTLTMNVLEQTRDLAVLRVIGATFRQMRRMIMFQALLLGMMGVLLGMVVGMSTIVVIHQCARPLLGQPLPIHLHPRLIVGAAVGALVTVILAAWPPTRRLKQLSLRSALGE